MRHYYAFVCTFFVCLLSSTVFAEVSHPIIVIDAGSSGSRLHLFEYETGPSIPIPRIKEVYSKRSNEIVLASFDKNPQEAGVALDSLIKEAVQGYHVAPGEVIPINILGTAGMRLLKDASPKAEKAIYENLRNYMKNHTLTVNGATYTFSAGEIDTIPSKMEAMYGWLTVNYLLHTFQNNQPTLGSIDTGGASIEVAFATDEKKHFQNDEESITLGANTYTVFRKSFLTLGLDVARRDIIQHADQAASCFSANHVFSDTSATGNFDQTQCKSLYEKFLDNNTVAEKAPLIKQIPAMQGQHFIAYSGAYFTYHYLYSQPLDNQSFAQSTLEEHIDTVCKEPSNVQLAKYCPQGQEKYCLHYCANGAYLDVLFYKAFELQGAQLIVTDTIDHQGVDFPLGAVLYKLVKQATHG